MKSSDPEAIKELEAIKQTDAQDAADDYVKTVTQDDAKDAADEYKELIKG